MTMMQATDTQDVRTPRRRKVESIEAQEAPAPADAAAEASEGQATEAKRRRAARRIEVPVIGTSVGSTRKLSVRLPILTWWKLQHFMADTPDKTEGEVIAPLLEQLFADTDFPRRPDWLLAAMGKLATTEEVSAN